MYIVYRTIWTEPTLRLITEHIFQCILFFSKSARTLTHFIFAINMRNNHAINSSKFLRQA